MDEPGHPIVPRNGIMDTYVSPNKPIRLSGMVGVLAHAIRPTEVSASSVVAKKVKE